MADRLIRVRENGRIATRGLSRDGQGCRIAIDENETLPITIDWGDFLGADTIESVTNAATSASVSGASNTTTTASFLISSNSCGMIEHRITTAAGTTKEIPIYINGTSAFFGGCRYYDC